MGNPSDPHPELIHIWFGDSIVKGIVAYLKLQLSGDNLFSAPKASRSFSNSNLEHLQHSSSDSDRLPVPETLQSTSYSEPLPAVPNTTTCSFHSDPSPDAPSEGCSKTSTSSKGNPETSSNSAPSNPNSAPTLFRDSPSRNRVRVTPVASDIKGRVIKVICDVKGQWWSGSMGNAGRCEVCLRYFYQKPVCNGLYADGL